MWAGRRGGLSFGYFSLAIQRKVTRASARKLLLAVTAGLWGCGNQGQKAKGPTSAFGTFSRKREKEKPVFNR
jgi:hypothetical protein